MARGAAGVPAAATQQRRARSAPAGSRDFCQVPSHSLNDTNIKEKRRGAAEVFQDGILPAEAFGVSNQADRKRSKVCVFHSKSVSYKERIDRPCEVHAHTRPLTTRGCEPGRNAE
ncbi:hypothetical protein MJG53_007879 [Ovis ammon polii x Ovis aries]|uniref:Uncharacterized protein n=2 Tax=Ovis TaxID=9935 RepID=A0A836A757_SHEEP|nr:hypothetical protein JEQ12_017128 [Ovis aries]KAI4584600.1 hypothetical protein MJG53_007879 [Ovis ammon polii x Ovis aries]